MDGQLRSGPRNLVEEIGGWPCESGTTLELQPSFSAVVFRLEDAICAGQQTSLTLRRGGLRLSDALQAARSGDRVVLDSLRQAAEVVGRVAAQFHLLLNPVRILVAGPLAAFEEEFFRVIRNTVIPLVLALHAMMPVVSGSDLREFAGALGGAALAARQWSPACTTRLIQR